MNITRRLVTATSAVLVLAAGACAVPTAAAADPLPPGGSLIPVAPVRILDTRVSNPTVKDTSVAASPLAALSEAGVDPSTVLAVLLNVTVVGAVGSGYVVLGTTSGVSNGNFVAIRPSATLALVGDGGAAPVPIRLSTPADVVVDLQGYVTVPSAATDANFTPVTPVRVADSRKNQGLRPFGTGQTQKLQIASAADLPEDATAVVANVTIASAAADTYVTAWGAGARPAVSTVNAAAGSIVANRAVIPLGEDGSISLFNYAKRTDVVVDVVGYLGSDAAGSYYTPATPRRLVDARATGVTLGLPASVPATASAVWLTVVGDRPVAPGYVAVRAGGSPSTGTSDLNTVPGRAVSNAGPALIGTDRSVDVIAVPSARIVVDYTGVFQPRPAA